MDGHRRREQKERIGGHDIFQHMGAAGRKMRAIEKEKRL